MAHTLDPMDLKQIIRLHLEGFSNRKIAKTLGIGRNCINHYIGLFTGSDVGFEELLSLGDATFRSLFPSSTTIDNSRYEELMLYFEQVNHARNHPGFTFSYHYKEYKQRAADPYGYTQFMEHYHRKHGKVKGSMKLEHEAGHEVFIDYAGKKLHLVDKATGELIAVEVFVAILPNSQYTYVEACMSQKQEDLITCMGNALQFYGGVPQAIVSDNLKSAVTRASKYEATVNKLFKDFAAHHNCVVNPTRTYAPQDKALVENAVHLAYQRIYYPLREMTFFTLEELNKEIRKRLEVYNDLLFQRKEASRKELFQSVEREYLKPLPAAPYELKQYNRAKVQKMGYVYFSPDKSYYSVPYRYIGKHTQIHSTQSAVEVYFKYERIATHRRNPTKGNYNTNKDHLSSTHKAYSQWSAKFFYDKAGEHGPWVVSYIKGMFAQGSYAETNYKRAMGVIQLHKTYGSERLNNACERAAYGNTFSYNRVKTILEKGLDKEQMNLTELEQTVSHIPEHDNIRGAQSYQ
jgi:hypothetical protein